MQYANSVLELIGGTPLVRLNQLTADLAPTVLVKMEQLNPGASIKDRIALSMIEDAETRGDLGPGGTIVEASGAGNTAHGLAIVAAIKGYKCIFTMPDKVAPEKISLLKAYGAEVIICPTDVPRESPKSYYEVAAKIARETPGAFQPNQYENPANPEAHYRGTGPEIWKQTEGKITVLVIGVGTGGTISGTGRYLKEQNPNLTIVGVDAEGSIFTSDNIHTYKQEGLGEDFWPKTFNKSLVDHFITVDDAQAFATGRRLVREEGILAGSSSGSVVFAALEYSKELTKEDVVVAILPDTGRNYLSKFLNDKWMEENGFSTKLQVAEAQNG